MIALSQLSARWAGTFDEIQACQRLRYSVFVEELGADGPLVNHDSRLERDHFDPFARHLMVEDASQPPEDRVIATARVLTPAGAAAAGGYYSETEFDLSALRADGLAILELGRTCLDVNYRRSPALHMMKALVAEAAKPMDVLIGAASFPGADPLRHRQPLSWLWHQRRRPGTAPPEAAPWLLAEEAVDRKAALLQMPPLLKAYLKMGAEIGDGIFVDEAFNCVDVLVLLDPKKMSGALDRTLRLTA